MQGNLLLYRGKVRMRSDSVGVRPDEIDLSTATDAASARGNVTIQVLRVALRALACEELRGPKQRIALRCYRPRLQLQPF